jgi:phosphoribosylamine--glycine ligase
MIDASGQFWPFEFTMRPSWPGFHNQIALQEDDPAQWMLDLLLGKDTLEFVYDNPCVSVVIAIPDFPYSHATQKEICDIPVYDCHDKEHVHLVSIQMGQDVPCQIEDKVVRIPHYVTSGDYVVVVTGCGETITGARRSAYAAVKKIKMPANPFFRTDIGAGRVVSGLPEIQKHGYAKAFRT